MALDNVKKEIVAYAEEAVRKIKDQEAAEVAEIQAKADETIADMKEKEDKKLKEAIELLKRQEISSAELESKKIVLSKKKDILAATFDAALEELESAPSDVRLKQYKAMVKAAKTVIESPKALVSANDEFTAKQLGVSSVRVDPRIRSGLIIQNEEETLEVDMQYSTLLQTIWDREIKNLSDILFG